MTPGRRSLLRAACAHCVALAGGALAQPDWSPPSRFSKPDLATDEGGLWALMDREEARLRRSPFRMRDEALNTYLQDVVCRLAGDHCPDVRVYAVRTPFFNASMAPNGMMQVWSGLLLRMDNEAQLAAVIGHEIGHFMQRHSVERLRDIKARTAFGQFIGLFGVVGLVGQLATLAGAMAYSRDHEREADRIGLALMRRAGYDPREAGKVWGNLLDELRATPDNDPAKNSVLFASHPPSDERRDTLDKLAGDQGGETSAAAFRDCIVPLRRDLLDDEIKRARPSETLVLLDRLLAQEPGQAELLHARGETRRQRNEGDDLSRALDDFTAALRTGQEPPVTHRSLGYLYRALDRPDDARSAWQQYLVLAPAAPDAAWIQQQLQEIKP
jgi:beta-barrel assembly-enhancing protease